MRASARVRGSVLACCGFLRLTSGLWVLGCDFRYFVTCQGYFP